MQNFMYAWKRDSGGGCVCHLATRLSIHLDQNLTGDTVTHNNQMCGGLLTHRHHL